MVETLLTDYVLGCDDTLGFNLAIKPESWDSIIDGHNCQTMSVKISGEEAYQQYITLNLRKPTEKSANQANISTILSQFHVEIRPKPPDPVS